MEINNNPTASKSSFLGRLTTRSMSEGSRKRGSNVVRGYIYLDDSISKTSNSVPEEPSVPQTMSSKKTASHFRRDSDKQSHNESIFAALKLDKKPVMTNPQVQRWF
ncbi:unnamed protein product [Microthlaspi erraticum]|uniref:Uncharacterized protein n=1 Tax=Microthlaspi erraticum TaxID=1685480 RepID=A0A6D2I9I9_9BRAS|nr:unnamed protein product [Microthlaspi erraticum]